MRTEEDVIARIVQAVLEERGRKPGDSGTDPGAQNGPARQSRGDGTARPLRTDEPVRLSHAGADITLEAAEALMKRVETKAAEMGMRVVTAVADSHGNPVAVRCMDGAYAGSFDVALNKTYTAAAFQMSTEELGTLSAPGRPLYGIQYTNQGRIVIFGGGIPLWAGGCMIGSFGVSGGTAEQDTALAHFAERAFAEMGSGRQQEF